MYVKKYDIKENLKLLFQYELFFTTFVSLKVWIFFQIKIFSV